MNPLSAILGGGGLSMSDSTTVGFNPFADNSKGGASVIVKSPGASSGEASLTGMILPLAVIAVIGLVIWKLFK